MRSISWVLIWGLPCILSHGTAAAQENAPQDSLWVYVGTYTQGGSEGIYRLQLNTRTGALTDRILACATENPSFLAPHPHQPVLYAVGEMASGGTVSAFAIEAGSGKLNLLNEQSSQGKGPCHVAVSPSGQTVLCANYGGGSIAAFPAEADGRLREAGACVQHQGSSVNPQRQEGPHAHCITLDATGRFVFAADLGLDKIMIYRLGEPGGALTANDPAFAALEPGAGPRHFVFHPSGRFAYVVNELGNTVTAFAYDAKTGGLKTLHSLSTLPGDFKGESYTAEIMAHPSGRYLYCSNRGHDSIASFTIDPGSGHLTPLAHTPTQGHVPRNFNIEPSGAFLLAANQDSGNLVVFRIDPATGLLTAQGTPIEVPMPVCAVFVKPF